MMLGRFLSYSALLVASAAASTDPATFFGGADHQAYLDFVEQADYDATHFVPSQVDPNDGAAVHWKINGDHVELAVAVRATGWFGFGLSENGGMTGSDMFIFDPSQDENSVWDAFVTSSRYPEKDECQDWEFVSSSTEDGFLMVQVRRKLVTGDSQDLAILDDSEEGVPVNRIIVAWGDDAFGYHGQKVARGAIRWFSTADEEALFREAMLKGSDGNFDFVQDSYPIKPIDTEYVDFCLSANDLRAKGVPVDAGTTMIGFEPIVTTEHVHHYLVFASQQENNNATCTGENFFELIYLWAPGEPPLYLPDFAGYSLGGEGGFRSFSIQYHYDNPTLKDDSIDDSGIRFYFSNTPREQELGILQLGDPFVSLYGQQVGEGLFDHSFACPGDCSSIALQEPVTVVRELLHMHHSGVTMSNKQMRNGEVIRTGKAEYFDFDQQGGQAVIQSPFQIHPGDSFKTDCVFRNEGDEADRIFGLASKEEMCIAYLMYYPRKNFEGGFPWICGRNMPLQACNSTHEAAPVEDDTHLDRAFGTPSTQCSADVDVGAGNPDSGAEGLIRLVASFVAGVGALIALLYL